MIYVEGGKRFQRKLVEDIALFCYNEMIPLIRKCDVNINIKSMKGYEGTCLDTDEREYQIDVNKHQSLENILVTVCHEMVHVKQFVRKELYSECIFYKTHDEYLNLPWEVEAYAKQEELYQKWLNGTTMNLRKLKLSARQ